ncbi:glycosyl hydrolase family 28-related protein [Paraburkholderia sp.]|uniref:right-handed parallel beta-helix repeat-containing protein n=1 Tax=Paraburkholderia sp. TaxID=1926495 RepID=UPI003D6DCCC5
MSTIAGAYSTNPYDYLNSSTGGASSSNQTINELIQFIEAMLMQMLNQNQNTSSPSNDMGGGSGGGGGGGAAPSFSMPQPVAAPMPAVGSPSGGSPAALPPAGSTGGPGTTPAAGTPGATTPSTGAPAVNTPSPVTGAPPVSGGSGPGALSGTATQPPNSINVKDYGAKGDGSSDDQPAIQNAIDAAQKTGQTVWFPPGTYNHSNVLNASGVKIQGSGSGTVLHATNPSEEAIKLGSNASISNLATSTSAGSRDSQPGEAAIDVTGSGDSVSNVTTLGAESNGIRLDGASGAQISNNLVEGSNADGIALMNGSTNNMISGNEVYQAGDDSFSDDSYKFDGKQDSGNVFSHDLSLDNSYGRSFALMGASGDTIENSVSDGSKWMGIVAGTDSNSQTLAGSNDTISNNLIVNSNGDAVDVMGAGGSLSQSGAGMNISDNSSSGSEASILGFDPVTSLTQRNQINAAYQPGTGNGANNGG